MGCHATLLMYWCAIDTTNACDAKEKGWGCCYWCCCCWEMEGFYMLNQIMLFKCCMFPIKGFLGLANRLKKWIYKCRYCIYVLHNLSAIYNGLINDLNSLQCTVRAIESVLPVFLCYSMLLLHITFCTTPVMFTVSIASWFSSISLRVWWF